MHIRAPKHYSKRSDCPEGNYHSLYRFNEANVMWLAEHFLGETNERRGGALTSKQKMQIYLRFVSDPGFQLGVAKEEGVHRTTVCKTVSFVLNKIVEKSHIWIKFPQENEMNDAQIQWATLYRFPCAMGTIDCTHVRISKPSHHGDEYINRKGFCSINVQATCNAREVFTSVDAQWPGSVHDSRILKRSDVYRDMVRQRSNALLLGDIGYGITPWLLTPYRNPHTPEEIAYNNLHAKERVIIERCFGQLKQRFPILQYKVRVELNKIPSVIISCVILHNIAKYLNDNLPEDRHLQHDEVPDNNADDDNMDVLPENVRRQGQQRRDEVKNIIINL